MPDIPDLRRLDWKDLYPRLLLETEGRLRRMVWLGELRGPIPGGYTAHDFVQTAYMKFADGRRKWNPELTPFKNFASAISSEISNRATAAENTHTVRTDDNVIQIVRDGQLSPEDKVAYDLELEKLINYLPSEDAAAKEMAQRILIDEIKGMRELAIALGVDQNTADATKKRLRKYVIRYTEEHPSSVFARTTQKASSCSTTTSPKTAGVATNDR